MGKDVEIEGGRGVCLVLQPLGKPIQRSNAPFHGETLTRRVYCRPSGMLLFYQNPNCSNTYFSLA